MSSIRHVGIVVQSIEVAELFWIAMGFIPAVESREQNPFISNLLGRAVGSLTTKKFTGYRNQSGALIELLEFSGDVGSLVPNPIILGLTHIALTVDSAKDASSLILDHGGRMLSTGMQTNPENTVLVAYFEIHSSVLLEIVEVTNCR